MAICEGLVAFKNFRLILKGLGSSQREHHAVIGFSLA